MVFQYKDLKDQRFLVIRYMASLIGQCYETHHLCELEDHGDLAA